MNNRKKKIIRWSALAMGLVLLTSCTANFCSPEDKAHLMFTYDPGLTRMVLEDNTEIAVLNDHVQKLVNDAKTKVMSHQVWTFGKESMRKHLNWLFQNIRRLIQTKPKA